MSDLPDRICIWEVDENDPNSTRGWTVSFPENHPNIYIRASLNTRHAAPVEGLERYSLEEWNPVPRHYSYIEPDVNGDYVRFEQAEAIIAAERTEKEAWRKAAIEHQKRAKGLEADASRWHQKAMDAGVIVHSDGTTSHPMRKERDDLKADNAALTAQTDAYGIALMLIREGCENPSDIARNALERFGK